MFLSQLWTIFILALSENIDDFIIGVAYGLRKAVISVKTLVIILMGSTFAMFVAMELGKFLSNILSKTIGTYLSVLLLVGLGCWMIWDNWRSDFEPDSDSELPDQGTDPIGFWETFLLGMALGMDDIIESIGLAMAGFPVVLTVIIFKLLQVIALFTGAQLGYLGLAKIRVPKLDVIPGLILILLGLKQLLAY